MKSLLVNQNYSLYTYTPTTLEELRNIIEDRIEKQGFGTVENPIDFNDIDISKNLTDIGDLSKWQKPKAFNNSHLFENTFTGSSIKNIPDWAF